MEEENIITTTENNSTIENNNTLLKEKPNFKYKENLVKDMNFSYWICETFDIYYPKENIKEPHLVYPINNDSQINIIRIKDKKLVKSLKGQDNFFELLKIFNNKENQHNYLISSDWDKIVFIWDLDDDYKLLHTIKTLYTNYIYSFQLVFKHNYIITSTVGLNNETDYSKVFLLTNGEFLRNIANTNEIETLFTLIWQKNFDEYYYIELCYEKIIIYNLVNDEIYSVLETHIEDSCGVYYLNAFISNNNKYLFCSSKEGHIIIWDLFKKTLIKSFQFDDSSFYTIIPCYFEISNYYDDEDNKNFQKSVYYILVADKNKKCFSCLCVKFKQEFEIIYYKHTINKIGEEEFDEYNLVTKYQYNETNIKCMKIFLHPVYNESILSCDEEGNIDLWENTKSFKINYIYY